MKQRAWDWYAREPQAHLPEIRKMLGVSAGTFVRHAAALGLAAAAGGAWRRMR